MLIKNCNIIYLDRIEQGSLLIENGKIKEGYDADLILFDDEIDIKKVFVLG